MLLVQKDRLEEARKLNDEVLKAQPSDVEAKIYKGAIDVRTGRAADAVDTLQAVLKNDPDNAEAHYQLGLAFEQLANANRAEAEWRDAVRLKPDLVEAHNKLAEVAERRGDWSFLAQEADQLILFQPGSSQGYSLRARADIGRKQYPSADEFIRKSLEREPGNPTAYVELGDLRAAQGQLAEAQKAYQSALDRDPNSREALAGILQVEQLQHQPEKVMATLRAQVARYPNNADFHVMLGDFVRVQTHDLAGAQAEFKRAAELSKYNVEALEKLALIQRERGDNDAALQTCLDAIQNNPKELHFYLLAGKIYMDRQNWDPAKQMFQKARELQPDDAVASNNLAFVILEQGGNVDEAFAMAQTARRQLPDDANSADTLGWAFYHKHVYSSAIGLFQEAVHKEPDNALFIYHLGLAYAKNGQAALAKQQLDRVVRIKPNSSEAEDLKKAVAEMKS
jgi:tetratricopeptide (TPR) repeat protein